MEIKFIDSIVAMPGLRIAVGIFNDAAYVCADQSAVASSEIRIAWFSTEQSEVVEISSVKLYFDNGIRFRLAARQSSAYLNYICRRSIAA